MDLFRCFTYTAHNEAWLEGAFGLVLSVFYALFATANQYNDTFVAADMQALGYECMCSRGCEVWRGNLEEERHAILDAHGDAAGVTKKPAKRKRI